MVLENIKISLTKIIAFIVFITPLLITIGVYQAKFNDMEKRIDKLETESEKFLNVQFDTVNGVYYIDTMLKVKLKPDYQGIERINIR